MYISSQNISQSISGTATITGGTNNNPPPGNVCPAPSRSGFTFSGVGYTITVLPSDGQFAHISMPGYINPKYVVVGVTYAPPGPQSFVDYSKSTLVGSTIAISNIFTSGYTVTVSVDSSVGILGFANGGITSTVSKSYSQSLSNSTSVTVEKTTTILVEVPGPTDQQVGVDHDFDLIRVWLNPVQLFTLSDGGRIQWNGYGYSTLDGPAIDIIQIPAGCLNGHLSQPACNNSFGTAFARTFAAGEIWPAGEGPGLTATDLQNILGADPYGKCGPSSPRGSTDCPSPDPVRYTQSNPPLGFQYIQAVPGQQPPPGSFGAFYSDTTTLGQSATYTTTETFGYEKSFSLFKGAFDVTVSKEQTLSWENSWNKEFTSGTSSSATVSITGPTCNVSGVVCSPSYPPSPQNYGQGRGFAIYQDNLYGTFLMIPSAY